MARPRCPVSPVFTLRVRLSSYEAGLQADSRCEFCQELDRYPRMRHEGQVRAVDFPQSPASRGSRHRGMAIETGMGPPGADEGARDLRGVRIGATHGVPEVGEGRGPQSGQDPLHVAGVGYLPELRQEFFPTAEARSGAAASPLPPSARGRRRPAGGPAGRGPAGSGRPAARRHRDRRAGRSAPAPDRQRP